MNFIKNYFKNIRLGLLDIKNKKAFIDDINNEANDPKSKYRQFNITKNEEGTKLSIMFVVPENFVMQPDEKLINMKIQEIISPVTKYLSYELGWAEYLVVPQIYHIEEADELSTEKSLTYIATWEWLPIKGGLKYLFKIFGITGFILGAITAGILLAIFL